MNVREPESGSRPSDVVVLVDTSVWIDHFRSSDSILSALLRSQRVLTHPCVVGELACENLRDRAGALRDFDRMPKATEASSDEVRRTIERRASFGRGVGWIDAHLLVATLLSAPCALWSNDKALHGLADELGVAFVPPGTR